MEAFCCCMVRRPPGPTRTDTRLPSTTLCRSPRARWLTAGDPELQRFAGSIARLHEDGQSNSVPRSITGGISTWQHLCEVLHFVCELSGVPLRDARKAGPRIKSSVTQPENARACFQPSSPTGRGMKPKDGYANGR